MHEHSHLFDFWSPSQSRGWSSPFQILRLSVLGPQYGQQLAGKKHSLVMRGCHLASAPHGTGILYMHRSVLSMGCIPCKTNTADWSQVNRSKTPLHPGGEDCLRRSSPRSVRVRPWFVIALRCLPQLSASIPTPSLPKPYAAAC
jgi:hypothetical protein